MKAYRYYALLLLIALASGLPTRAQQVPIGQWRDELPYTLFNSVTDAGDRIYASTPYAVVCYNKSDNSVVRISKISGLSDIGISCISYNKEYKTLVIAYSNANIDLLKENTVINISDIKRKQILGNKTINHIHFEGKDAYLSCGFGIVILDISREEIRDTYYIGKNGSQVNVLGLTKSPENTFYAATEKGIYKADATDPNLANYASWKKDATIDSNATYTSVVAFNGKVYVNKRTSVSVADTIYSATNGIWSRWNTGEYTTVMRLESNDTYLLVSYQYKVKVYDAALNLYLTIFDYQPGGPYPQDAIADSDGWIWVGDTYSGLISYEYSQNKMTRINLSGPNSSMAFSMTAHGNDLYIAPGGRDASFIPVYTSPAVYHFNNTDWTNLESWNQPLMSGTHDIVTIAVDPNDPRRYYAGTFGSGLLEFYDDQAIMRYDESNSTLKHHTSASTDDIRVGGTAFDKNGNLWVVTAHNNSCLSMKQGDQWTGFTIPIVNENDLGQLIIDRNGQKWIQMRYGNLNPNSLVVFTDNGTPQNPADDQSRLLNSMTGSGSIPGNSVYAMAEDLNGEIWIGTEKGVAVFYSPENVFSGQNFDAQRILVTQGGYVQYLLENETVTAIAVDGANRKWIGTDRGGVFLFSEDGTKEIYHFTADNSPLLSDRIICLAINKDGDVFFGTDKGVVSFRASATPGGDTNEDVYAFPNPVKPDYEGYIAVKGLVSNAQVRITDVNGVLVYSTRAEGGQAIWDGKNFDGKKAHAGVYLVFAANDDGTEKVVTRILIIN
jgi:ligand-binding sensor domain-containing protein